MATRIDILDVGREIKEQVYLWNIWIGPLMIDRTWYTKNYFNETMEALEKVNTIQTGIIFKFAPPPMIILDH